MTADGAEKATADAAFLQNTDTPWGFYRYAVEDGTYEKFQILDANSSKAKPANGDAWYSNDEYVFISENGNCHSLPAASPAIMFTAPADGIYFATVTIHRDKSGVNTPLYLRSRYSTCAAAISRARKSSAARMSTSLQRLMERLLSTKPTARCLRRSTSLSV